MRCRHLPVVLDLVVRRDKASRTTEVACRNVTPQISSDRLHQHRLDGLSLRGPRLWKGRVGQSQGNQRQW